MDSLPKKSIKTTPGTRLLIFINKIAGEQQDYPFYQPKQTKAGRKKEERFVQMVVTSNHNPLSNEISTRLAFSMFLNWHGNKWIGPVNKEKGLSPLPCIRSSDNIEIGSKLQRFCPQLMENIDK